MGALMGAVVGDLIGIPHEFSHPDAINTVRFKPSGGGPFNFPPGVGSDDTDMLLAAIDGYDHTGWFDANTALDNYLDWFHGHPPDVGAQTRTALLHWADDIQPPKNENAQGNGGLMRAAAHGIMSKTAFLAKNNAMEDTMLTHPSTIAAQCSGHAAMILWRQINGPNAPKTSLTTARQFPHSFRAVVERYEEDKHHPGGHCVHTLKLAKRMLYTARSFESGIARTVRAGGDTDTNAAVAGAFLGAKFGESGIPKDWIAGIDPALRERLEAIREQIEIKESEVA